MPIRRAAGNNANHQQALLQLAENQADARAAANLCRLLSGDQASWSNGFIEMTERNETSAGMGKALKILSQDTLNKLNLGKDVSENLQDRFINIVKSMTTFNSAIRGQIPPGVRRIKWTDEKGDWAYVMMIYNPSMTQQVRIAKEQTYSGQEGQKSRNGLIRWKAIRQTSKQRFEYPAPGNRSGNTERTISCEN